MIPLILKIKNFGSFREEQELRFPVEPGLYFMTGRNELEPRLGANATGKSTVWKALCWLFFEKTPLGLKAGNIANWDATKGAMVSLVFLDSTGEPWQVTRTWGPNSWRARRGGETLEAPNIEYDLSKGKENPVLAMLAMDFMAFTQSVILPQGGKLFLELDSAKQAALFGEVMQQDTWLERAERASARTRSEDLDVRKYDRQVASFQGSIDALRSVNVDDQIERWEQERERKLDNLEKEHAEHVKDLKKEREAVKVWTARTEEHRSEYDSAKKEADELEADIREAEAKLNQARDLVGNVRGRVETLREQLDSTDANCPLCGAERGKLAHKHREEIERQFMKDHDDLKLLDSTLARTEQAVNDKQCDLKDLRNDVRDMLEQLGNAENNMRSAQIGVERADKSLDLIERDIERLEAEQNPYKNQRERTRAEVRRLTEQRDHAAQALDAAQTRFSVASGWVRWFKDIRLAQIGSALEQLELEANNEVSALGLVDWELQFDVDRQTATGSIARGFNVTVRSPRNTSAVPWEVWSGGEGQRLIAATQMGLSNLIRANLSGPGISIEVWDEPTKGMSPQGVQDLLEALHARALAQKRCIWIVDHHTLGFSKFAGSVCVVKTARGSHFEIN